MSSDTLVTRGQARLASDVFASIPGVAGICVFGSVARGTAHPDSDIDLLVLGTDPKLRPSDFYDLLPPGLACEAFAISYYSPEALGNYLDVATRFGMHLRREGWLTHDPAGILEGILKRDRTYDPMAELARQKRSLEALNHANRFGGRFLFPLAHVYRIGRTSAYIQLARYDEFEFDQVRAFERLAALMPVQAKNVHTIRRLSPFYARTRRRDSSAVYPFDPNGPTAGAEFRRGYNATLSIVVA